MSITSAGASERAPPEIALELRARVVRRAAFAIGLAFVAASVVAPVPQQVAWTLMACGIASTTASIKFWYRRAVVAMLVCIFCVSAPNFSRREWPKVFARIPSPSGELIAVLANVGNTRHGAALQVVQAGPRGWLEELMFLRSDAMNLFTGETLDVTWAKSERALVLTTPRPLHHADYWCIPSGRYLYALYDVVEGERLQFVRYVEMSDTFAEDVHRRGPYVPALIITQASNWQASPPRYTCDPA